MTILEKLEDERVVTVELHENATVARFTEHCDEFFTSDLSKKELEDLIIELQVLHAQMRTTA